MEGVQERAVQRSAVKKKKNQASGLWGFGPWGSGFGRKKNNGLSLKKMWPKWQLAQVALA